VISWREGRGMTQLRVLAAVGGLVAAAAGGCGGRESDSATVGEGGGGPEYHVDACRDDVGECIINIEYE